MIKVSAKNHSITLRNKHYKKKLTLISQKEKLKNEVGL